jgi:hypothetical protein
MPAARKILLLGASYGSLLASKLLMAGHTVRLVCLPAEAELMNKEGFRVRMPVKGRAGLVEIDSRKLPGMSAGGTGTSIPPASTLSRSRCRSRSIARPACASCSTPSPRPKCLACRS